MCLSVARFDTLTEPSRHVLFLAVGVTQLFSQFAYLFPGFLVDFVFVGFFADFLVALEAFSVGFGPFDVFFDGFFGAFEVDSFAALSDLEPLSDLADLGDLAPFSFPLFFPLGLFSPFSDLDFSPDFSVDLFFSSACPLSLPSSRI